MLIIKDFPLSKNAIFCSFLLLVVFFFVFSLLVSMFGAMPWGGPLLPVPPGEFAFVSFHT